MMQEVYKQIGKVAGSDATVLVLGESGTGKELVAKAVHNNSPRKGSSFVVVNCAAIPENLLESELYGHVRGAFTGAISNKRGMFEEASGGTLLLDEIAELHPALQAKLLRTLDEGKIRRVGDTRQIDVNARLICSTNKNLEDEVRENRFRLDLYHRVRVIEIKLPPLRERKEDIPMLVKNFIEKICAEYSRPLPEMDTSVMRALMEHKWIGNVRELINTMEQAILLCEDNRITERCISHILTTSEVSKPDLFDPGMTLKEMVGAFEREAIRQALAGNNGNRKETARKLGISERSLYYKMEEFKLT